MLILGAALVVAAIVLVVFGVTSAVVSWLLWFGIVLAVVGLVFVAVGALAGRRNRQL